MVLCASCHRPIDPEYVDAAAGVSRCDHCGQISAIADLAAVSSFTSVALPPSGVRLLPRGVQLNWTTHDMPDPGLATFFLGALLLVVVNLQVGIAFVVTYLAGFLLLSFVNRSTLQVEEGHLVVRHGPVPWAEPAPLKVSAIRSLRVENRQYIVPRKHGSTTYDVVARLPGGDVPLVRDIRSRDVAEYLRDALSEHARLRVDPLGPLR